MRLAFSAAAAAALIGVSFMAVPATAVPLAGAVSKDLSVQKPAGDDSLIVQIQHRRGGPRHGGRRFHGGGGGDGGAVAAGIIGGLLLGAIIASEAQRRQGIDYCIRRYRSYDPHSMTFVGRDGRHYRCP